MRNALVALVMILSAAAPALAQPSPGTSPSSPTDVVPAWVFDLLAGLSTTVVLALVAVIIALWSKLGKKSALTEEQGGQLKDLHEWHDQRDKDGVLRWMVPRAWVELLHQMIAGMKTLSDMVQRLVEQNDGISSDLRQQLKDRLDLHDRQQVKMLKLAVRVQRAVEALAGFGTPEIESDLDDIMGDG